LCFPQVGSACGGLRNDNPLGIANGDLFLSREPLVAGYYLGLKGIPWPLWTGNEALAPRTGLHARIPPHLERSEGRNIARVLRSVGWVRFRYGPQDKRIWGWRWREWNVSHVKIDLDT
jgi:hypothetical protein